MPQFVPPGISRIEEHRLVRAAAFLRGVLPMPEISRFFGIVISINYNDHAPPHFHARYGGYKAIIDIQLVSLLEGSLPTRVLGLVTEWAGQHRAELLADWELARQNAPLNRIPPLE